MFVQATVRRQVTRASSAQRPRWARGWLAAVAVVALFAQLASLAHLSLVQHELCLEHGEYTHVSALPQLTAAEVAAVDSAKPQLGQALAQSSDEHDHCSVLVHRVAQHVQDSVGAELPTLASLPSGGVREPSAVAPTRALYRLSPKQSPPAGA